MTSFHRLFTPDRVRRRHAFSTVLFFFTIFFRCKPDHLQAQEGWAT